MWRVAILGEVEVWRGDERVAVPRGRAGELLVRLALDAGAVVRTDRLLEDLWADAAAITTRNTLQSKVARLRRALGEPSPVESRDGGYALAIDAAAVDAFTVVRDAADAARLLDAGDAAAAAALAAHALQEFRGDVLPSVEGEWVRPFRTRLDEARAGLLETAYSARLQLGAAAEVIGELEAAVVEQPFHEALWALLITALYRAGRQRDALAACRRVRTELAEQLGLEPGPALRRLEQQILDHEVELGAPTAAGIGATSNLPSLAIDLVGRDAELDGIDATITEHRLVEIVGPGGAGKTAIAIEAGRRRLASEPAPDGATDVWFVRLDEATTASEVTDAVIAALGVTGGERALVERLKRGRPTLILDNCEHVVDAAAALAAGLLDAAPNLRVLVTSQVPLGIDGEVLVELEPLPIAAAVELFARRARSLGRAVGRDAEADVETLCRSLDGLPLAIELAAARTKTLSLADIIRRLDDRFSVLHDPSSRRPERRRALRSTIAWSYDLLFPDDQRGLWALATFAGGATLDAVEHVLAALDVPAAATIDVLGRLASRSLLIVDDTRGDRIRYRLLDSIRAFALDAARDDGSEARARRAHTEWFAAAAEAATAGTRSAAQAQYLDAVRSERANIDAALAWSATADPQLALRMAVGFGWPWIVLGDSRGAERILAALDAAGPGAPAPTRASALLLAGWIEASTGELDRAYAHVAAATEIADATAAELQAQCAYYLAYVVSHEGRWLDALELTDRSARLLEPLTEPWHQAANALFAARAAIATGDPLRSRKECDEVRRRLTAVDDPWLHARGEAILGELARVERRFADAVEHFARASETSTRLGFRQTAAYQRSLLGRAQCQAGDYPAGVANLAASIEQSEAIGDPRLAGLVRVHLARALRAVGDMDAARTAIEAATEWHRAVGGGEQAALGECILAALDAAGGEAAAGARLETILVDARQRDDAPVEVLALDALARIAATGGDHERARALLGASDARMEAASHFITELDRVDARAVRQLS